MPFTALTRWCSPAPRWSALTMLYKPPEHSPSPVLFLAILMADRRDRAGLGVPAELVRRLQM